jgi:NhaA family Na+:H+ antiporter
MKTQVMTHRDDLPLAVQPASFRRAAQFVLDRFLLLPIGAAIALVWANTFAESYFRMSQTLAYAVNEVGMALFLGLIVEEAYEEMMPGGSLHRMSRLITPIVAAAGGFAGSALVFLAYVNLKYELVLAQAWPAATAVDVAAAYYLARVIWRQRSVAAFVLMLALATDAFGLVFVVAGQQGVQQVPLALAVMASAIATAWVLRQAKVTSLAAYLLIPGALSWMACYLAGIFPALAMLPIVPLLPRAPRRVEPFADAVVTEHGSHRPVREFEHRWNIAVQVVLFFFGLVNAGVVLKIHGTGTWAMVAASVVGRPLGILAGVALATAIGLKLPKRMTWPELVVAAFVVSGGFTFPLFLATGLLPIGPILGEIKLGALSSVAAAIAALLIARRIRAALNGNR